MSTEKSESHNFFTKHWSKSEDSDHESTEDKSRPATKTPESGEDEVINLTKSPADVIRSKFRKNQKSKKPQSKLTKKLINVWKRDSKKKGSEEDDTDDESESEKTSKTPDRREDPGSEDEDDKSSIEEIHTASTTPSPKAASRKTKEISGPYESAGEDRPQSGDPRGRHPSEQSKDERTDATVESRTTTPVAKPREKTSTKVLLADESSHMSTHGLSDPNLWNVISFEDPIQRTKEDWEEWKNLIYYPSTTKISLEEKLPEDISVRFLEDEGIFVGKPLELSPRNRYRLENRIITEKSIEWFGQNGKIVSFPDPYRPERIQLCHDEEKVTQLINSIQFKPAKLDPFQEFHFDPKMTYEIAIDIGFINFKHHSFFSKEHVIASRLESFYEEYTRRKEAKGTERSENKLKALREAIHHCREAKNTVIAKSKASGDTRPAIVDHLEERVRRYRKEMKKTRAERDESWRADKISFSNVLETWKALKSLRSQQEFTITSHKLNIITVNDKYDEAKEIWKAEIAQELEDLREEFEEEFKTKMHSYRVELKEWTESRRQKKQKRRKKPKQGKRNGQQDLDSNENKKGEGSGDDESGDLSDASDSSGPSLSSKPVPPLKFDEETTRNEIIALFHELKRLPGEPKISLELVKVNPVTPKDQVLSMSSKESQRQKATDKTRIEFKIIFNAKEVYKSPPKEFSSDFSVFFGLTVPISVREWPESLKLIIIEIQKNTRSLISEVQMPLPNKKTSIERCNMQKIEFESTDIVKTNHAGVGSGVPFSTNKEDNDGIFTSGYVSARIGWTADQDGNIMCPPGFNRIKEKEDPHNFDLSSRELLEKGDIQKWSENVQLDPNDPRNAKWLHTISKRLDRTLKRGIKVDDTDTLNGREGSVEEFDLCSWEDIESSPRFRLLELRYNEVPEFKHLRMIPPNDRDIPSSIFEAYERRLKEDGKKKPGDSKTRKRLVDDDMDYEFNRLEKIKEIRTKVLRLFESSLKQITFDDIILEEQIPDIGTLGLNIMTLFQPRRPLRPTRRERKRVQGSTLADTKLILIVNIVRAFNLPIRKDTDIGQLTTESVTGIPLTKKRSGSTFSNLSTVKPFVEVWFQRNVCRTTTALGANPTWNQELQLNLVVPEDDYSQDNLNKMDDLVYLLVYDEVAIDLLEDDRRRDTDIYQRLEKRWLGSITIPFSTLYTNGRIEGTFKLNSPTILLGYEVQGMSTQFMNPTNVRGSSSSNLIKEKSNVPTAINNQSTFITLFMTLQPAVQRTISSKEESATGETSDMMAHVRSWKQAIIKKFPDRNLKPFVMNTDGETILCIRYLKAIEPPASLCNPDQDLFKNMEELAHFVSLFPSVRDSTLGITDYSLWFTSDVFVATPGGGTEDHAVLLACFFLHLNVPTWIVQGNAIPDGPTAYVVTSFKGMTERKISKSLKNSCLIWNPCSGEYYLANDNFCPLQAVWAIVGHLNMWANVSENERPHQLDWDFSKSSNWNPLFPKPLEENKVSSVQIVDVIFKPADQVQANSLAQRVERHLKDAFMKWRKTSKTKWNRYCTAILRRLLPRLEEIKYGKCRPQPRPTDEGPAVAESVHSITTDTPSNFNDEHLLELKDVMTTHQITGFPLQQSYINMELVTESVFATGVHTIDTPRVEFAIAAYARSFPAGVYSVWVYIAALHRRK